MGLCPLPETRDPGGRRAGIGSPSDWVPRSGPKLSDPEIPSGNMVAKEGKLHSRELG